MQGYIGLIKKHYIHVMSLYACRDVLCSHCPSGSATDTPFNSVTDNYVCLEQQCYCKVMPRHFECILFIRFLSLDVSLCVNKSLPYLIATTEVYVGSQLRLSLVNCLIIIMWHFLTEAGTRTRCCARTCASK